MNYMDAQFTLIFDNSYYMKAVFETKQKDTVSLRHPIDRECLAGKWKWFGK